MSVSVLTALDPELVARLPDEQLDDFRTLCVRAEQDAIERPWAQYPSDPTGYARNILGVELTPDQQDICCAIQEHPYKVKCDSAHNVGKTFVAAVLANWWFDQFENGIVITTAPTERDVVDLLWTEIRLLRQGAKVRFPSLPMCFIGPRAPEMFEKDNHYAKGYTSSSGESFQGRHRPHMFFIFDEDEGIDPIYYVTTKTMFKPEEGHAWFSIGNPTTTTSAAYLETQLVDGDGQPTWKLFRMSALDHPNIKAQLAGEAPKIANAITLPQLQSWVEEFCSRIPADEHVVTDIEWPPNSAKWWRPGPIGCARILGRRPDQGTYGVWSPALWEACERLHVKLDLTKIPEIGCDVAHFGDDWTAWHVRWGSLSLHHESVNGWDTVHVALRCKQLAEDFAAQANKVRPGTARPLEGKEIAIKIDDDGVGKGVSDQLVADGYNVIRVSAGSTANKDEDYPNRRSELWFDTTRRAETGGLDLHLLPQEVRLRLKMQALAPVWKPDARGRRVVERKDETKKRLGRSPDDMDALNLSYAPSEHGTAYWVDPPDRRRGETMGAHLGTFGRETQSSESDDYGEQRAFRWLGR